ncbi:MAG: hypothetical protein ACLFUU_05890 [Desulfobacteraceae bacterium]
MAKKFCPKWKPGQKELLNPNAEVRCRFWGGDTICNRPDVWQCETLGYQEYDPLEIWDKSWRQDNDDDGETD